MGAHKRVCHLGEGVEKKVCCLPFPTSRILIEFGEAISRIVRQHVETGIGIEVSLNKCNGRLGWS